MATQAQIDAAYYEMVHRMLNQPSDGDDERRGNDRYSYPCDQMIAPYNGRQLPQPGDFVPMPLHDLSTGGFSFLAPHRPQTSRLVVALGKAPRKFFTVEVRHCTPAVNEDESQYLVGCRFCERLDIDAQSPLNALS